MSVEYPVLQFLGPQTPLWRVVQDCPITVPDMDVTVTVTAGYDQYDGASIPSVFWEEFGHNFTSRFIRASLAHDFLYDRPSARVPGKTSRRRHADRVFYKLLVQDGVARPKAWLMWAAVRVGGGPSWCPESKGDDCKADPIASKRQQAARMKRFVQTYGGAWEAGARGETLAGGGAVKGFAKSIHGKAVGTFMHPDAEAIGGMEDWMLEEIDGAGEIAASIS